MELSTFKLEEKSLTSFQVFLLSDPSIKKLCQEFLFYKVLFYREDCSLNSVVYLQYPKGNIFWYVDFKKYIHSNIYSKIDDKMRVDFDAYLFKLKLQIKYEYDELQMKLDKIRPSHIVKYQLKHRLRDYQSYDLLQFLAKYKPTKRGLILSEQRTGKTRVALATLVETSTIGSVGLVICPKTSQTSWAEEVFKYECGTDKFFNVDVIKNHSSLKKLEVDMDHINLRIITYDLFKRLTIEELLNLISNVKEVTLICDEAHRLRNFKTDQSKAIFDFKDFAKKYKINLGIIGVTGTPSVKQDSDVFGVLSLINDSKIALNNTYIAFDLFKEYFYVCDDTQFGKIAKALKRESEINFILQRCAIQTKQHELDFFKDYKKVYKVIELDMDIKQKQIYKEVFDNMEYDEDIDCQNKLVQLVRLQQICVDPSGLVPSYDLLSPKLTWILDFAKNNDVQFIVSSKKTKPLHHLMEVFDSEGIKYSSLVGSYSFEQRKQNIEDFVSHKSKVMLLQQDTGRESLTLPNAEVMIFLDRDFAVGFNEQTEARMTPIDGKVATKLVIDLLMKDSKEIEIYNRLVVNKESIDAMNFVFKTKKEE